MISLELIDVFGLLFFLISVMMGFYRGLIWELLKYLSLFLSGGMATFILIGTYSKILRYEYPIVIALSIWVLIFIVFAMITFSFSYWLSNKVKKGAASIANKLFGGFFGALRALLFVNIMFVSLMIISHNKEPDWIKESVFLPALRSSNRKVQFFLHGLNYPKMHRFLDLKNVIKTYERAV